VLLLGPFLLITWSWKEVLASLKSRLRCLEMAAFLACLLLSAWVAIDQEMHLGIGLKFIVLPCICWAAIRFGAIGASTAVLLSSAIFAWQVSHVEVDDAASVLSAPLRTAVMQAFLSLTAVTGLLLGVSFDERKRREEQLRQQAMVMDQATDMITITDLDGHILYVNEAQVRALGRPRQDLIGRNVTTFGDDAAHGATQQEIYETTHATGEWRGEVVNHTPDGRKVFIECRTWIVRNDKGVPIGMCGVASDITERKRMEEARLASEERYRALFETMCQGVVYQNPDGRITSANPAAERILGLTLDEMNGRTSGDPRWQGTHEDGSPFPGEEHPSMVAIRTGREVRDVIMRVFNPALRSHAWIRINALPQFKPGQTSPIGVFATFEDITGRCEAERRIRHLNRILAVLSDINQAIVRIIDPRILFDEACRIAVEKGGFCMAWIGVVNEASHQVEVAAHAGKSGDYLNRIDTVLNDPARNYGPTGQAILSADHLIINDIENDPRMNDWRDAALRLGFRAVAALPLSIAGKPMGAFNLYSEEAGFFNDEELRLLDELASDISFALEVHQREIARQQAEQALKESEHRYQDLYENAPDMYLSVDVATGNLIQCNQTVERMTGFSKNEILGRSVFELYHPDCQSASRRLFEIFKTTGVIRDAELQVRCKDGRRIDVSINVSAVRDEQGRIIQTRSVWRDITPRKQAEARILDQLNELQRWQDVMLRQSDHSQELKREVNELARRLGEPLRYPSQAPEQDSSHVPLGDGAPVCSRLSTPSTFPCDDTKAALHQKENGCLPDPASAPASDSQPKGTAS
jgi:PAS domain S-box-containing protein